MMTPNAFKKRIAYPQLFLFASLLFTLITPVKAVDWIYTMRPGDTLWTVCETYTNEPLCWQKLGPLNDIARDRAIPPGSRITIPVAWLKVPPASVVIDFVQGSVTMQQVNEAAQAAVEGTKLRIGATLKTDQGTVSIRFADGSSMLLEPFSSLALDTLSNFELNGMVDSSVRLNQGTVKTRVVEREPRSRFRTITPSAVAAVRGTEYRVNVTEKAESDPAAKETTLVEVYQGLVDVGAEQKNFDVPANFGIVAKQGEPLQPPVQLLPAPELKQPSAVFTKIDALFLAFEWMPMEAASAYQLFVLSQAEEGTDTEKLLNTYRVQETRFDLNRLALGCYLLRLHARDQQGLQGLPVEHQVCLRSPLATPVFSLELTATMGDQQQLNWHPVTGADQYLLEHSSTPDFNQVLESKEITETMALISLQPEASFVRVKALNTTGEYSLFSAVQTIPEKPPEEKAWWQALIPVGVFLLGFL